MSSPFVAEIRMVPFNFPPTGWAFCNGQLLPLSQNTALFSLLGTFYGGDGKSTFALPDLQGSVPLHQGQGPGLSIYDLGQTGGTEFVTLLQSEMPIHTHTNQGTGITSMANNLTPEASAWSGSASLRYTDQAPNQTMSPTALAVAGGSLPHNNRHPYLAVNFIIAMQGVFPPRS